MRHRRPESWLRRAGLNVVAGVDADETCRYAFETNNDATFVGRPLEASCDDYLKARTHASDLDGLLTALAKDFGLDGKP